MKIQILGSGCEKCRKLMANAEEAVKGLGIECECEKVSDINKITEMGVMMTPALVIDGKVISTGKVLPVSEITDILKKKGAESIGGGASTDAEKESACSCSCGSAAKEENSCCCGGGGSGKKILTFILLGIVAVSVFAVVMREMRSHAKTESAKTEPVKDGKSGADAYSGVTPAAKTPSAANVTTVYYFHGNKRCFTCNKIETLAKAAVNAGFADDIKSGAVTFKSVNVDDAENQHFIKDFELASRCVVVQCGTKFERLEKVWELVGNEPEFTKYIQQGVEKIRAEKK